MVALIAVAGSANAQPTTAPAPTILTPKPTATPAIPDLLPQAFAVMTFENRSGVRGLDWLSAAIPFVLAEKVATIGYFRVTHGPAVVSGRAVAVSAEVVAEFAKRRGASWVWTGWLRRPEWDLQLAITLWRIDGDVASRIGTVVAREDFKFVHRMTGNAITELCARAKLALDAAAVARTQRVSSKDFYAFTLFGRGAAALGGVSGPRDLLAAEKHLARAVFIDPELVEAQRLLASIYRANGLVKKASSHIGQALSVAPDYYPALAAQSDLDYARGRLEQVREVDEKMLRLRPWDLERRFHLGKALWENGDPDAAFRELDRVVGKRRDDVRARRILALIHATRGDGRDLVRELEAVVALDPLSIVTRLDLAAAYKSIGDQREAASAYESVLALDPHHLQALKFLGDLYMAEGDSEKGIAYYRRALAAKPDDPRAYFLLGAAYIEDGNDRAAKRIYRKAQRFKAYAAEVNNNLGAIAYREGKHSEAVWYLRRAVNREHSSARYRYNYALALSASAIEDQALAEVEAGLAIDPDHAELNYLHGVVLLRLGRAEGAATAFARALDLAPDHEDAAHNLALLDEMRRHLESGEVVRESRD